jgi:purine-binding chemotaxis protein CheW
LASTQTTPESTAESRLLLFAVAGKLFGCDIAAVREIVPIRSATRLPGAPEFVRGLINLRGSIVTVVDLAVRLGTGSAREDGSIILVEHGSKHVGVAVDEVRDVQVLARGQIEDAQGDVARGGIVRGLGHLDLGVVIVLDVLALARQVVA